MALVFWIIQLPRSLILYARVSSFIVIIIKIFIQQRCQFSWISSWVELDLFLLHAPQEPFDENIVGRPALAAHREPDRIGQNSFPEHLAGKLASLIGVRYLWGAISIYCLPQDLGAPSSHPYCWRATSASTYLLFRSMIASGTWPPFRSGCR